MITGGNISFFDARLLTLGSITSSVIVTAQSHSGSHHSQAEQLSWGPGDGQSDDISGLNISQSALTHLLVGSSQRLDKVITAWLSGEQILMSPDKACRLLV